MPRILVIDDSAVQRLLTRSALEEAGHVVLVADGGQAGLEIARRESPDCILLDWFMPETSGVDVLRILQAEHYPGPVIVVTGEDSAVTREECSRYGAAAIVEKPRDIQDLLAVVDSIL